MTAARHRGCGAASRPRQRPVNPSTSSAASAGTSSCGSDRPRRAPPVGVWKPLVAVAHRRRRPRQEPVIGAADDPHGHVIRSGRELPRRACSISGSAAVQPAAPWSRWASSSTGRCSKLVVMSSVTRRRPAGVARIAAACGATLPSSSCMPTSRSSSPEDVSSAAQPPAGRARRRSRRVLARPAGGRRSRRASCRRCARRKPGRPAPLDRVGERASSISLDRRSARMAGERDGEHVVRPLERRQDEPHVRQVSEKPQAEKRRAAAAAMRRGERRIHDANRSGRVGRRLAARARDPLHVPRGEEAAAAISRRGSRSPRPDALARRRTTVNISRRGDAR